MNGDKLNIGMTQCEYSEYLIGKCLPNGWHITKIK